MEDFDLKNPSFYQYIAPSIDGIIQLANEMSGGATTVFILELTSRIIEVMGEAIRPYAERLIDNFAKLWSLSHAKGKVMILASIVRIMSSMVCFFKNPFTSSCLPLPYSFFVGG